MIHPDHLGTPQKMIDASGVVVWSADYKPFGEATVNPSSTITNNLRFPGQYYDAETALLYNVNRTYNTALGRYIEGDSTGVEQGTNHLYLYANGNPVIFADPFGLLACVYVTDSHTMSCVNNKNQSMSSSAFFSGTDTKTQKCINEPSCRNKKETGPLPPGTYSIFPPGEMPAGYKVKHPEWMYLHPNAVELGERDGGFYIHLGTISTGCIVQLKTILADFNKIKEWAIQDKGGTLRVISTSDPVL